MRVNIHVRKPTRFSSWIVSTYRRTTLCIYLLLNDCNKNEREHINLVELNWSHLFSLQSAKVVTVAMCVHILRRHFDRNLSSILSRSSLPVLACHP